jgi:hypothetical protein
LVLSALPQSEREAGDGGVELLWMWRRPARGWRKGGEKIYEVVASTGIGRVMRNGRVHGRILARVMVTVVFLITGLLPASRLRHQSFSVLLVAIQTMVDRELDMQSCTR